MPFFLKQRACLQVRLRAGKCGCRRPRGQRRCLCPHSPWGSALAKWLQSEENSPPELLPDARGRAQAQPWPEGAGPPTIMPIPTEAWAPALSPSERFSVTERPRSAVSEDRRLISSPVRVLSKKATSCLRTEENREARSRFTMRCPARANGAGQRGPRLPADPAWPEVIASPPAASEAPLLPW